MNPMVLPLWPQGEHTIIDEVGNDVGTIKKAAEREYIIEAVNCHDKFEADNKFLLARSMEAGSCSFRYDRDVGVSSNSIIAIAFGLYSLNEQKMPSDAADLAACIRAFDKLPNHRRTKDAIEALNRAKQTLKKAEKE